jgi:pimeloyl-ACP methyl ester carboxylesterase
MPKEDRFMPYGAIERLSGPNGELAFESASAAAPTRVWLSGFRSDMNGTKASALAARASAAGAAFVRFDYSGCGQSAGAFEEGSISRWLADTLAVIDAVTTGPLLLIGSSMGGWLALLAALERPERVAGLVLIAPAPDFTERLMWADLSDEARDAINRDGVWMQPSAYGDGPYPITRTLIEDGRSHLLLDAPIPIKAPVHIVHGQSDPDVPWGLSLELAERLESEDVRMTFVKSGDHRLSTPADLSLLAAVVDEMAERVRAG